MSRSFRAVAAAAAASCACAAPSAFAQSSVTAYGLMDVSVGSYQSAGGVRNKAVNSGDMTTSFLGFKGTEDLGGGVKAVFALEHFLRPDTGEAARFTGDGFWARSAFVGLKGDFGTTTLGRNTTPFFVSTLAFNPFGDSFSFSPSILHYYLGALSGDSGWSNSIAYASPKFGNFNANLLFNRGEAAASKGNNIGGNVLYFGGKLSGSLAYQQVKNGGNLPALVDKQQALQAGIAYDFDFLKAFGQAGQVKDSIGATEAKARIYQLGVSVPVGAGKVLASYGHTSFDTAGADTTRKNASVGYDHNLSKRTDLYGVYMNERRTGLSNGNSYALGMRHTF